MRSFSSGARGGRSPATRGDSIPSGRPDSIAMVSVASGVIGGVADGDRVLGSKRRWQHRRGAPVRQRSAELRSLAIEAAEGERWSARRTSAVTKRAASEGELAEAAACAARLRRPKRCSTRCAIGEIRWTGAIEENVCALAVGRRASDHRPRAEGRRRKSCADLVRAALVGVPDRPADAHPHQPGRPQRAWLRSGAVERHSARGDREDREARWLRRLRPSLPAAAWSKDASASSTGASTPRSSASTAG